MFMNKLNIDNSYHDININSWLLE